MRTRWLYPWALGAVAFGGASLLVPLYVVQLGGTASDLGLLAASAAFVAAPGGIFFGRLAGRVGHRRPLVVATLATVAAVLAVLPFLTSIPLVIAANAILWLMVSSVAPVLTMLVVDGTTESEWSERIGRLNAYQGYGWAGGLVVGTVWPLVAPRLFPGDATSALFWLLAACAAASTFGVSTTLPRSPTTPHVPSERTARRVARVLSESGRGIRSATFPVVTNRLYWTTRGLSPRRLFERVERPLGVYLLAGFCFFTGSAVFWAPLPLFLFDIGFDAARTFAVYLVSSLASAVLYDRVGRARGDIRLLQSSALTARSLLFPAVTALALVGTASLTFGVAVVGFAAIGATWAVIAVAGTAIVTKLAPSSIRGQVLGVYTALGALGGGVGSALGGWVATFGYLAAFALAGGLVLVSAGLVVSVESLSE